MIDLATSEKRRRASALGRSLVHTVCGLAFGVSLTLGSISVASAQQTIVPEQERPIEEFHDPLEGINRVVFAVNDGLDFLIIRPIAEIYRAVLPSFVRRGVGNFLANVATPITLANDLLQGEWTRAETTMVRFMLNSTAGLGGLDDIAERVGYVRHTEDFGQTLAVYGVPSGPYLVLPIIGPSNPRDAVGLVVDLLADPWFWVLADEDIYTRLAPTATRIVHARSNAIESLDAIRETSPDYYASMRSLYNQNRQSEINNGTVDVDSLPEIPDVGR